MRKPLHKHIGNQARKFHGHFTKYLYERDTIFATLWVFIFIIVLGLVPINFYFLNPLKLALKDFDFNDIAYAKLKKGTDTPVDNRIVIINIGMSDREELSQLIDKTASMGPKIMGLDVLLEGPRVPYKDSLIAAAIERNKNLVIASRLNWKDTVAPYKRSYFAQVSNKEGYVNMLSDDLATVRLWAPYFEREHGEKPYGSFASALVKEYDPAAFEKLEKRHKSSEIINYTRHVNQYLIVEGRDLLDGNVDTAAIKNKIALLGYISLNPLDIEDKKFTPMNEKFAGKSIPDMNGIVVHANIISMVLDKNYIKKLPSWVPWLVAILIGWLHMSFFIRYYLENHIWFHLVAKIAQLASAIFFVYFGMYLFDKYRIKLDMKMTLIVIVMAVDVIYFYEAWATWMHRKYKYHTVFKPHQH